MHYCCCIGYKSRCLDCSTVQGAEQAIWPDLYQPDLAATLDPSSSVKVKVNVDAALDVWRKLAAVGVVIHDDRSLVLAAFSNGVPFIGNDVLYLEALALFFGVRVAQWLGYTDVMLESESELLFRSCRARDSSHGIILVPLLMFVESFAILYSPNC